MGLSLEMALCKGTSLKMAFLFALLVLLLQPEMAIAGKWVKPAKAEVPPLHWWRIRWSDNEWVYSDPFWRSLSKAEERPTSPMVWKIPPGMLWKKGGLTSLVPQVMQGSWWSQSHLGPGQGAHLQTASNGKMTGPPAGRAPAAVPVGDLASNGRTRTGTGGMTIASNGRGQGTMTDGSGGIQITASNGTAVLLTTASNGRGGGTGGIITLMPQTTNGSQGMILLRLKRQFRTPHQRRKKNGTQAPAKTF